VYYFVLNESCVLLLTAFLHKDYIHIGDLQRVVDAVGWPRVDMGRTGQDSGVVIAGVDVSARLIANFLIATAFCSLLTPLQIPFCLWTLPKIRALRMPFACWRA
jgi:hypothetical protein